MADDYIPHTYQDDLDNEDTQVDPLMAEENEDIAKELGIPPEELEEELRKIDTENDDDDNREFIEDLDEDQDDTAQ